VTRERDKIFPNSQHLLYRKVIGNNTKKFGFDYGTSKAVNKEEEEAEDDEYDNEKESQLLKEVDILQYVDDLTDKDKQVLNEMSSKYGIKSYARLLRVAKKDRDDELRALKRQQQKGGGDGKSKDASSTRNSRRANERRKLKRRSGRNDQGRYRRRHSPSYEPYKGNSDSEETSEGDEEEEEEEDEFGRRSNRNNDSSDFVIEFGSSTPDEETSTRSEREENGENEKANPR
jgi:hypothetical protein